MLDHKHSAVQDADAARIAKKAPRANPNDRMQSVYPPKTAPQMTEMIPQSEVQTGGGGGEADWRRKLNQGRLSNCAINQLNDAIALLRNVFMTDVSTICI